MRVRGKEGSGVKVKEELRLVRLGFGLGVRGWG